MLILVQYRGLSQLGERKHVAILVQYRGLSQLDERKHVAILVLPGGGHLRGFTSSSSSSLSLSSRCARRARGCLESAVPFAAAAVVLACGGARPVELRTPFPSCRVPQAALNSS